MGGAARNARKSRQQAAAARSVAQARGSKSDRNKIIAIVVAVVVVAALVIGGVLWINSSKNATQDSAIQPGTTSALGPGVVEKRDGAVVSVGKPGAPKTMDLYADFLCPYCAKLQQDFGQRMEKAINDGQLTVRYHMVILLNKNSDPPGYSLESANAALAAADQQKFTAFHDALFKNQPPEGGRGYDKAQLIKLGQDLGINDPKFAQAISSRRVRPAVAGSVPADPERPEAAAGLRQRPGRLRHADGRGRRQGRSGAGRLADEDSGRLT